MFAKRGQITIFIILGILLVIIAGIVIFSFSLKMPQQKVTPLQTEAVVQMVEKCLEQTAEKAILTTGKRGGYFILPLEATTGLRDDVPYFKNGMNDFFPSSEKRAEEIGKYIDTMLDFCLDFTVFEKQGYNIIVKSPYTKVVLSDVSKPQLDIRTELPLTFKKGLQTKKLEFFRVRLPAEQLQKDFLVAQEIVKTQEGRGICITCFSDLADENSLFVEVLPYYDNVYVYEITDEDYVLGDEKYVLRFAVKYGEQS
ncbi:hypothetical protein HYX13_02060 [Candidatus Woesearchaeota archaeon]|nr:hypothetical protein [Candidatus Woesearchaeota archaeon]